MAGNIQDNRIEHNCKENVLFLEVRQKVGKIQRVRWYMSQKQLRKRMEKKEQLRHRIIMI